MLRNVRLPIAMASFALVAVGCASGGTAVSSLAPDTPPDGADTTQSPVSTTAAPTATTTLSEITVTGVVIDVVGGLAGIDSFTLRLPDGTDLELAPAEDLLFGDAGPISHIRDHLVSGAPVTATYRASSEGLPIVVAVDDAGGGHSHDD